MKFLNFIVKFAYVSSQDCTPMFRYSNSKMVGSHSDRHIYSSRYRLTSTLISSTVASIQRDDHQNPYKENLQQSENADMYTIQREYDLISQKEAMNTSYGREGVQGKCG